MMVDNGDWRYEKGKKWLKMGGGKYVSMCVFVCVGA